MDCACWRGTQGLALLGRIEGRRALLILDAVAAGGAPGDVHVLNGVEAVRMAARTAPTAHEGGAGQLLAYAELLGDLPGRVTVVGVEPENIHTGLGLSATVEAALPEALERAREALEALAAS
ncbi:MAG: hydrogenase maturation protease [Candidatus Eisenbacteria bacterium]|nr:hydrogenase maturation protease [Candidatus Eisenbacteria bacterium]